jgi:NAD(P)H-hydrate epimerase
MKFISSKQMAEVDRVAMSVFDLKIEQMMENAGRSLARFVSPLISKNNKAIILFGKGNNGGDGLVTARHLAIHGKNVQIVSASLDPNPQVKHELSILKKMNITPSKFPQVKSGDFIIDSLLGYNIKGNPRPPFAKLINQANLARKKGAKIISFDLPSGLDPDTGFSNKPTIQADYTLTLALPKTGLKNNPQVGKLYLVNLGIPNQVYHKLKIPIKNYFEKGDVVKI